MYKLIKLSSRNFFYLKILKIHKFIWNNRHEGELDFPPEFIHYGGDACYIKKIDYIKA